VVRRDGYPIYYTPYNKTQQRQPTSCEAAALGDNLNQTPELCPSTGIVLRQNLETKRQPASCVTEAAALKLLLVSTSHHQIKPLHHDFST
jgi:hypothetical protein